MHPRFAAAAGHVVKAWGHVRAGGRLGAILADASIYACTRENQRLRALVAARAIDRDGELIPWTYRRRAGDAWPCLRAPQAVVSPRVRETPCATFKPAEPVEFVMDARTDHRCLTVCAPFAHLIASGAKSIENRPRKTNDCGPLFIHAGLRRSYGGHSADYWATTFGVDPRELVYGAIVGVVDCQPVGSLALATRASAHAVGPWCWLLAHARRLAAPVPFSGKLGLIRLDPFTLSRVGEELKRPFNLEKVSSC